MDISNLDSLEKISINFNIDKSFLEYMKNRKYTNSNEFVEILSIKKKNKKLKENFREVIKIESPYNIFYKELLIELNSIIKKDYSRYISNNAYGFLENKNTKLNAQMHLNKTYLQKFDIKNFFTSITIDSVQKVFIDLGCSLESASLFSLICTYNNTLKEGFNTSPLLSNLFCFELDKELEKLTNKYNVTYTRYGDDITFSSNQNSFPKQKDLEDILSKYGFSLNTQKTLFVKRGQSQYVTGLSISDTRYPRVPRKLKRNIRLNLYQLKNYFNDCKQLNKKIRQLYGKIVYVIGIEENLGKSYKNQLLKILEQNGYSLNNIFNHKNNDSLIGSSFYYIDESEIEIDIGKTYYLAMCAVCIYSDQLNKENKKDLENLKEALTNDYKNGLTDIQRSKIFHYAEDNTKVKEKVQDILRTLKYEAFIVFTKIGENSNNKILYKEAYLRSFKKLFANMLLNRNKNCIHYIYPEINNKIKIKDLETIIKNPNNASKTKISKANKTEILLTIPDYILGIFTSFIKEDELIKKIKSNKTSYNLNRLNEISDKIRMIYDIDTDKYYSRQNKNKQEYIEIYKNFQHIKNQSSIKFTNLIKIYFKKILSCIINTIK